jgi:hypothetical protein
MCGWDRVEAHAHARKLAAVAELARRNPGELDQEFTRDQVAYALGESRARADSLIGMAQTLPRRLPGTKAGLEDGTISRYKAEIIAGATLLLEDDEARAAEAEVLDRAARLTPAGLRAAIARAVITVAPKKAKERRETAAKNARVEQWLQDTGNAALMGSQLPPAEALAADEHITARAKELRAAGAEGDMDQHATCTSPVCRRPAAQADFEHNTPYEAGGRTCLCNTGPKCRHDHRLKQHPRWKVDQLPDGTFRWTTPAGRTYTTEPTRYPI